MNFCCLPERNTAMDELEQEETLVEKWQDIREGINDAAMELVSNGP